MKTKVLIIVGPTSSGKSSLAVKLARRFNGEIISADSRQVYRGLNIGTGKITKHEMKGVPHHLLDVASPRTSFNADDFVKKGRMAFSEIAARGRLPIAAGGTGFYIDALVGRIVLPSVPPNARLRRQLEKKTTKQLFALLKRRDPKRATALSTPSERNNKVRLIRALEIAAAAQDRPRESAKVGPLYDPLWIGIAPDDKTLRLGINKRLRERLRRGMPAEALRLHADGLSYKRMNELGLEYRSLARLLQKKITRVELEEELRGDIWRYSRKQIGYWKRNKDIEWFKPKQMARIEKTVAGWLSR